MRSVHSEIRGKQMTNKQRILHMVERWPDDIPFDKALYHLNVLKAVVEAIWEADRNEGTEHEEVFRQLLSDEEENHDQVEPASTQKPRNHQGTHRARRAKNRG
jgi:hypothetical protein